ncbi:MAG TPA: hypothetical protein P5218_02085 [Planctomycetota bacterium]|nr:hypothetical protein [Planctomycetota bacterium]HPF15728.1 hypothetical protein [Planctomycetota bacterium]HRV80189.1 hypothetical protein [Planctomycetota bacterium]
MAYRNSAWKNRTFHLQDLMRKESSPRHGLVRRQFEATLAAAPRFGAERLNWSVLDWNVPAPRCGEPFGTGFDRDWNPGRLRKG